ncbi:hypothetical protein Nepgr_031461 [Nepenthes gracilis]|uniref:Uncharacterized protein n=1 Tax=Nepenthes gracilis TaxID=150966 RepID=A0AAD3TII5_NEPGR|nr:hypothetical protein Nepgr_031461 [Nepenthes gracilis]
MKPRPNAGMPPRMRAVWRPKPLSCADAINNVIVSPGYSLAEKSSADDLGCDEIGVPQCDGEESLCDCKGPVGALCIQSQPPCGMNYIDGAHSDRDCLIDGFDCSTPESIARINRKYSLVVPDKIVSSSYDNLEGYKLDVAQVTFQEALCSDHLASSQVLGDLDLVADPKHSHEYFPVVTQSLGDLDVADMGSDPMFRATKMLTGNTAFRHSLRALAPDHKNLVILFFFDKCWYNLSDQAKDDFKSSFPIVGANLHNSDDAPLEVLRISLLAHPNIGFLCPLEEQIVMLRNWLGRLAVDVEYALIRLSFQYLIQIVNWAGLSS